MNLAEPITAGIVNYNGINIIGETIRSLKSLRYPIERIIVADDGSTDGSVDYIRQNFPEVEIIVMDENTKRANHLRNILLQASKTRLVFLVDNDIILDENCLGELVSNIKQLPNAAACTARVLVKEDKTRVYSDGNILHYVCNSIAENRDEDVRHLSQQPKVSIGCIGNQLVDKEKARLIDFMDEDMSVGWGDDGEFHHRLRMAGMECYLIPRAIIYHRGKTEGFRTIAQVKNRAFFIIKNYSLKTLFFIFPALIIYEMMILFFLIIKKDLKSYFQASVTVIKNIGRLLAKRRKIQKIRQVSDGQLMTSGAMYVAPYLLKNKLLSFSLTALNFCFDSYWKLIKPLL